jgi:hypothetical protein
MGRNCSSGRTGNRHFASRTIHLRLSQHRLCRRGKDKGHNRAALTRDLHLISPRRVLTALSVAACEQGNHPHDLFRTLRRRLKPIPSSQVEGDDVANILDGYAHAFR